jgi:Ca-activated chloride channel family protein
VSEITRREEEPPFDRLEPGGHHHRSPENGLGRLLLAAAIVLILVAVAGGTTWWMYTRDPVAQSAPAAAKSSGPACPSPQLRVAAAPEIAPVVRDAATSIAPPRGGCAPIEVVAEEPWATATTPTNGGRKPDVWIPSSSVWLGVAAAAGTAYTTKGAPLARTPIVLAAPTALTDLYAKGAKTSWAALVGGVTGQRIPAVSMPDAQRTTVGMLSVYAVNAAMRRTTKDAGIAQLQALTLRSRLVEASGDTAPTMAKIAGEWNTNEVVSSVGVFPTTEQQLSEYKRGGHTIQLEGAFPADGLVDADYPFAIAKNGERKDLADRLRKTISRTALTQAGFRTKASKNALQVPADPAPLLASAGAWSGYRTLTSQVLLLIDASGSMNDKIKDPSGRTITRAALLRESGRTAAQLFGEDTSIGMWYFGSATPTSPAHTEVVPFGPITSPVAGKPRRDALAAAMTDYRADTKAGTPLYQSVLDASSEMQTKVRPGAATLIVVLTDGDDGETKYSMSDAQFLDRLNAQRDPQRPVPVIAVGYGPDADMKSLTAMATATGGKAIAATNPADLASAMAKAFLAAHQ